MNAVLRAQTPDDSDRLRLVPWRGRSGFLTSIDGRLQKATWSNIESGHPVLEYSECGPEGFEISAFGVSDTGNFLYFPCSKVGTSGLEYDDSGEGHELPEVELYQIMTVRMRDEMFLDPFVFCEVSHPVDVMEVMPSDAPIYSDVAASFLSVSVEDAEEGSGDIWYTAVPFVRCVTIVGCEAYAPIAYPGQELPFLVTVSNDGNTYLTGFSAQLKDAGSSSSAYAHVSFSEETIVESCWNPEGDNGSLVGDEPDFALAPGKTSAYKTWFTIPEDWEGRKTVKIVVESIDKPVQLTGQAHEVALQEEAAELNSIEFIPADSSVTAVFSMAARQKPVTTENLSDAPITVLGDSGSDDSPGHGGMADPTMAPGPLRLPKAKHAGSGGAGGASGAGGAAGADGAAGDVPGAAAELGPSGPSDSPRSRSASAPHSFRGPGAAPARTALRILGWSPRPIIAAPWSSTGNYPRITTPEVLDWE